MRLQVRGQHRTLERDTVRDAVHYYTKRLFRSRNPAISVTVTFVPDLLSSAGALGTCQWTDSQRRPRRFHVMLHSKLGSNRALEILAHEMVHVWQYATGRLRDIGDADTVEWDGKRKDYTGFIELNFDAPWEVEAYGRQVGLYTGFVTGYNG